MRKSSHNQDIDHLRREIIYVELEDDDQTTIVLSFITTQIFEEFLILRILRTILNQDERLNLYLEHSVLIQILFLQGLEISFATFRKN